MRRIALGVNIDHIATLRNARGENDPSVIELALLAQNAGADLITVHLREDRRHIRDEDVFELKKHLKIPLNLEMALSPEILAIAKRLVPATVCLVPERRQEITTEGGLDAVSQKEKIREVVSELRQCGVEVFLFLEPDKDAITAARETGARGVELHTGAYARAFTLLPERRHEWEKLKIAAEFAASLDLEVHAGHGLNYHNVQDIARLPFVTELNIGHAIVARSLRTGLAQAILDMRRAIDTAL
ncbi:MAG: pyridoxine 5'-phosphate synthase [Turneriella sp.]|nr:pyridoxine 5'-phosphate synthase [Turneriella sp.]